MREKIEELSKKIKSLWREGKEKEMLPYFEIAIILIRQLGDKKLLIEFLNEYAGALRVTGNYEKSIEMAKEATDLIAANYSKESESYATAVMNLGNVYRMQGDFKNSEKCFVESEEIFDRLHISTYSVAGLYNNFSLLYQSLSNYQKAYEYQIKSIEINRRDSKYNVPLGISYNNLYNICKKLNKVEEGEKYLHLAEETLKKEVGEKHPLYCSVLNNFADLYYTKGQKDKAVELYEIILPLMKGYYGENSNDYLAIKRNYELVKRSDEVKPKSTVNINIKSKGMDIARDFFNREVLPFAKERFPSLLGEMAFGLVGNGSECFGFDDEISQDHDFGKRCCVWLSQAISPLTKDEIAGAFATLDGRVEVYYISDFYRMYTLCARGPQSIGEFRRIPADYLATATNGEVFYDPKGEFTAIRERLLEFYPEDLIYKRMAYCLNKMAQSGQYNYSRCLKRGDLVGAEMAFSEFILYYAHFMHLVNKRYMPFYKWFKKSLETLPNYGAEAARRLEELIRLDREKRVDYIEDMCIGIKDYLLKTGLSTKNIDFLTYQAQEVILNVKDKNLREEDTWTK